MSRADHGDTDHSPDRRIRVVIADDYQLVRIGMRAALVAAKDIDLVGEAEDGLEAVALVKSHQPDVVVMDLEMPNLDGAGALAEIVASNATCRVLILSMHGEEARLVTLMRAGAAGYVSKSAANRELVDAIRIVAQGGLYVHPSKSHLLMEPANLSDTRTAERRHYDNLTERERELLVLIASGFTAADIGNQLKISVKTIATAKEHIRRRLGIAHRSDYVQLALRLNLLKLR